MKKRKIVLSILIICTLVLGSSFMTKAASSETVSIYHVHGDYCGTTTTYVTQDSDFGGGGAGLRTVSSDTCGLCGDVHHYYAFDSVCSCGKSWSTTGHACINSPYGSNGGSCSNYSVINCNTSHQHPISSYACGIGEDVAVSTIQITSSTDAYAREVKLSGIVTNASNISNLKYSWSTGETADNMTVTSNGTYTLTISGDNIKSVSTSLTINNVDATPPTITSLTANVTVPTSENVILTVKGSDINGLADKPYSWDGTSWSTADAKTVTTNGTYTAYVKDAAGNVAKKSITVSNIDRTVPSIQVTADITAPTNGNVTMTVTGSDALGLADKPYSWDGTTWSTTGTKAVTSNGTYMAYVKDVAGNVAKKSITVGNIDKTAPDITVIADITVPTSGNVTLTVTGTDASGLATESYSWDGINWSATNAKEVTANGAYTAYIKDAAGNVAKKSITVSNIDKTAPDIKVVADVAASTSGSVILTVTGSDASGLADKPYSWDGTTWSTTGTKTVTANGTYTAYVKDVVGNVAKKSITVSNIDKTAPSINVSADVTAPTNGNIVLTVIGSDNFELATEAYSFDGSTWSATNTKTVTTNGTYMAYVKDVAGNVAKKSITVGNIDKTAPDITVIADITVPTSGNVTLTVTGTDASGLATESYSWDGINWSATNAKEVTANGAYTAYIKDAAGNVAKKIITVSNIDKIAPDIKVIADDTAPTNGNVNLSITGSDASGLATEAYSWDGTTWNTTGTKTVSDNGTYTGYVKDAAGNVTEESIVVSNIDRKIPSITITADVVKLTSGNVKLVIIGTDANGLEDKPYSWDGTTWSVANTKTVTSNGTYTAYVKDAAGNVAKKSITVSNIDKTAPSIQVVADVTTPTAGNVTLTVTGSDALGLADKPYSWDGTAWSATNTKMITANGTYTAYVKDAVGNVAEKSIDVTNIFILAPADKTPPEIKDLYLNTTNPVEEVIITVVVEEEDVLISWDGGISWGTEDETKALANGVHTVLVKDEAGNIASKSIEVSNVLVLVKEVEKPSEEPEEVQEEPSEEPENEPEEPSEEQETIEVIEIIQEEPEIKGNIELWDVVKVAAPVTGGGFFFFFGFWFLTQNATVYVQEGMIEKCLGKIRIKKSGKGYVARISSSMVRKATSNQYRIVVSKRFLKKNEGMYCSILVGTKEISSRLEREMHVEG